MLKQRVVGVITLAALVGAAACGSDEPEVTEEPAVAPVVEPAPPPAAVAVPLPVVPGSAVPDTPQPGSSGDTTGMGSTQMGGTDTTTRTPTP